MLDWLLAEFEKEYHILIPEKDKQGFYALNLKLKYPIIVQDLNPGIFIFSRLTQVPLKYREELFIYLMKANFLGQGTGGAVIGMEKDEKFLTLSLTIAYEINYKQFKENLEDFLNYIEYWREEIKTFKK